jgi:hypothetical protein
MTEALALQLEQGYYRLQAAIAELQSLLVVRGNDSALPEDLRDPVQRLTEDLAAHFSRQEEDGYLEEVQARAPYLHDQRMRLYGEQRCVLEGLQKLRNGLVHTAPEGLEVLRQQLLNLLKKIDRLEEQKDALILKAFTMEPAALD